MKKVKLISGLIISLFLISCSKIQTDGNEYYVKYQAQGKGTCSYLSASGQTIKRAVGDLDVIIGPVKPGFNACVSINITSGNGYCSISISENNKRFVTVAEKSVTWIEPSATIYYKIKNSENPNQKRRKIIIS